MPPPKELRDRRHRRATRQLTREQRELRVELEDVRSELESVEAGLPEVSVADANDISRLESDLDSLSDRVNDLEASD